MARISDHPLYYSYSIAGSKLTLSLTHPRSTVRVHVHPMNAQTLIAYEDPRRDTLRHRGITNYARGFTESLRRVTGSASGAGGVGAEGGGGDGGGGDGTEMIIADAVVVGGYPSTGSDGDLLVLEDDLCIHPDGDSMLRAAVREVRAMGVTRFILDCYVGPGATPIDLKAEDKSGGDGAVGGRAVFQERWTYGTQCMYFPRPVLAAMEAGFKSLGSDAFWK